MEYLTNGRAELDRLNAQSEERDTLDKTFGVKPYSGEMYHFPASTLDWYMDDEDEL